MNTFRISPDIQAGVDGQAHNGSSAIIESAVIQGLGPIEATGAFRGLRHNPDPVRIGFIPGTYTLLEDLFPEGNASQPWNEAQNEAFYAAIETNNTDDWNKLAALL